ncbi:MAG: MmgE/PrpD family protein, partial [Chloroflexota bacterium]
MEVTMNAPSSIISTASTFVAQAPGRAYPEDVAQLARMCLADWYGVALGARGEPAGEAVRRLVEAWRTRGRARLLHSVHSSKIVRRSA